MVSGCYGKYFVIDTRAHASLLDVHFKPGGGRAIWGLPLGEISDQHVDLGVLWGPAARRLRERLGHAASLAEQFKILEAELVSRLARSAYPSTHSALTLALQRLTRERRSVGAVASELGLTRRRFIELFSAEVWMTPKLYGRVQRFQSVLARAGTAATGWPDLALEAGYCDQSHLIRDFVSFSGFAPSELVRHRGPAPKEHHLADLGNIRPRRP